MTATLVHHSQHKRLSKQSDAIAYAIANGWELSYTKRRHIRMRKADQLVICGPHGTDYRGDKNALARLRRVDRQLQEGQQTMTVATPPSTNGNGHHLADDLPVVQVIDSATAAEILGCKQQSVSGLASQGKIRRIRRGQFDRESVESYAVNRINGRKRTPAPAIEPETTPKSTKPTESTPAAESTTGHSGIARHLGRLEAYVQSLPEPLREKAEESLLYLDLHLQELGIVDAD